MLGCKSPWARAMTLAESVAPWKHTSQRFMCLQTAPEAPVEASTVSHYSLLDISPRALAHSRTNEHACLQIVVAGRSLSSQGKDGTRQAVTDKHHVNSNSLYIYMPGQPLQPSATLLKDIF